MKLSIETSGLFNRAQFRKFEETIKKEARKRVIAVMHEYGNIMEDAAADNARRSLKGNKAWTTFRYKVYSDKPGDFPALKVGSKVPWMGTHEYGPTIRGPLLIPLIKIKRSAFRRLLWDLEDEGNIFWVKGDKGRVVLMAEVLPNQTRRLGKFKSPVRKQLRAAGLSGRLKRGTEIPIAVLVPRVQMRRRLRFNSTMQRYIPKLAKRLYKVLSK